MASRYLLVDSHCHIDFPDFSEDWEVVAKENGVEEGYRLIILNQGESDE